jgi:hypothetical protein
MGVSWCLTVRRFPKLFNFILFILYLCMYIFMWHWGLNLGVMLAGQAFLPLELLGQPILFFN